MINRAYSESQLQPRSRHFSLSDVVNVRGQPRGDGARVAAVRVPSLLDAALVVARQGGHVGAVAPGAGRASRNDQLRIDPDDGGSRILRGGDGRARLGRPLLNTRRRLVHAVLPLIPRRSLTAVAAVAAAAGTRLLTPW